jgi:hypothetical protein
MHHIRHIHISPNLSNFNGEGTVEARLQYVQLYRVVQYHTFMITAAPIIVLVAISVKISATLVKGRTVYSTVPVRPFRCAI